MTSTGILIARFQVPEVDNEIIELISDIASNHQATAIVLGVSPLPGTKHNPYTFAERRELLKSHFPGFEIIAINDHPDNKTWSNNLDKKIEDTFPDAQFTLYGSKDGVTPFYTGKYKLVELGSHKDPSPIEDLKNTKEARKGMLHAYQKQYNKVYPTVDVALFRNNKADILLGKKATMNKWRLIGGFVDPEDESYEAAAKRELMEECGELEIGEMVYETSGKVDDWRYRNEADKVITTLFSCDYISGKLKPQDDIVEAGWHHTENLLQMIKADQIVEEHIFLFNHLAKKYG